ncbi:MAG: MarR family transcriptional regulator [Bryobacterales bacterium]|nr:MarR family transcriptional regulator [Bryobacterales bacterium]
MLNALNPVVRWSVSDFRSRKPGPSRLTRSSLQRHRRTGGLLVPGKISAEIRLSKSPIEPEVEAFLNIQRTAEIQLGQLTQLLRPLGLSPAQYNVLRILRGAGEQGLPCGEIATRMISRDPDITRLIDRMEQRGWVTRTRSNQDRRVVTVSAQPAALEILAALDEQVAILHRSQFSPFNASRVLTLISLLEELR